MQESHFDFAVLGDSQPEGLLVASGLARKGFSVTVVPSSSLGELPAEESWPLTFPSQLGQRRLDDLLFRAGFFRLEESGLVSGHHESQMIMKKHRLSYNGSIERLLSELNREFPEIHDAFIRILELAKRPGEKNLTRAAQQILNLKKQHASFALWLDSEMNFVVRPSAQHRPITVHRYWLLYLLSHGQKLYRVDPVLKQPYHLFLAEHARKWGVKTYSEPFQIRSHWSGFHISASTQVQHLIVNGMGGARVIAKQLSKHWPEQMRYWMFVDTIECDIEDVPEPLEEFSQIDFDIRLAGLPSQRVLRVQRDSSRARAVLQLGSWLPYDDSKMWLTQIELGRQALLKLMPFFSQRAFRPLPSLLDLTEMRGECMKRGQMDRLDPMDVKIGRVKEFFRTAQRVVSGSRAPFRLGRGIFAVTPHFLSFRNRMSSFEESLKLLDHFNQRRQKYA